MIELSNKKVEQWKKTIDAISAFLGEGNFRFNDKGVFFKAMDPSQVVLIDLHIEPSIFDKYKVEPSFIGLNLNEFSRIMNRILPEDKLKMEITDSEFLIDLEGELNRSFALPLIDVNDDDVNLPQHKADATVEINARILKEALKDASLFGSSVVLNVKNNQFSIDAKGSQGTLTSIAKQASKISVKSTKDVTIKFSLNFLQNIIKEADPTKKITLELKNEAPMRVTYTIGKSPIVFHLAHMIL